jgi:hypothetical protein
MNTTMPTHETSHHTHAHPHKKAFWDNSRDRKISIIILSIIGGLLIFKFGMFVGYHKALFSYRSDDRGFSAMMDIRGEGMMKLPAPGFAREEFGTGHGATGRVVSISLPSFVVASPDNSEKTVTIGNDTLIRRFKSTVPATDIQTDDYTVVLGDPDETGAINARFIRLMPMMINQTGTFSR